MNGWQTMFYIKYSNFLTSRSSSNEDTLSLSDGTTLRVILNETYLPHISNYPGYFSSSESIEETLISISETFNKFTCYLNVHPVLVKHEYISFSRLKRFFPFSECKIDDAGYSYLVELDDNKNMRYSKSVKQKVKKFNHARFESIALSEFYDVYMGYWYPEDPPYFISTELKPDALISFSLCDGESRAVALFGYGELSKISCGEPQIVVEYLLAAAEGPEGRNLSAPLIDRCIHFFTLQKFRYLNLGGGIFPGDHLENFKSWFGGEGISSARFKFVSHHSDYLKIGGSFSARFPGYHLS